jgi:hypothetical protein
MTHCSSFLRFFLAAFVLVFCGMVGTAYANPTIAMRKCSIYACDSAESLRAEGRAAAVGLPWDSIVLVTSDQYPLSAFVRVCPGSRGAKNACLITSGDLGAIELDNEVFARASKIAPIDIPEDVARSATSAEFELVQEWPYGRILEFTLRSGVNPWHNLFDPSNWHWMEFHDHRTGETQRVYSGDRITVRFADGSTAQLELVGLAGPSGHFVRFVPESIRLPNGEPWGADSPPPAYPTGAGIELATPWVGGGILEGALAFDWCSFLQSHCLFVSGGYELDCHYRRHNFPC